MTERRYSEEEAALIFERAAEAQHVARRQVPASTGMTLAQLEQIGEEVGIPRDLVAKAARSLAHEPRPSRKQFLGLPIGVGRTVELGRRLSDDEWKHLVVDLRETFDAVGRVREDGAFRQWSNGNLRALVEPTPSGDRVRLQTRKGDATGLLSAGTTMMLTAVVLLLLSLVTGQVGEDWLAPAFLFLSGGAVFASSAFTLPGWARLRERQMEEVAARLTEGEGAPTLPSPLER